MRIHCVWMWLEGWEDLAILAELGVQVGGQRIPCASQGLGLVATTQLWSGLPLHAPATSFGGQLREPQCPATQTSQAQLPQPGWSD